MFFMPALYHFCYNVGVKNEIEKLKRRLNAVILAHNYCLGEVQDVADYTGDSLELARRATQIDADVIVFCGVLFMAETAAILNPEKTVLIPDLGAGCPMADMITGDELRRLKSEHPGAKAVCYVNSTAEVKAECDICVTSGNAEKVMRTFSADDEIIFVPDQHLGGYIAGKLNRTYRCWKGFCPIHAKLNAEAITAARDQIGGNVPVLVHPECAKDVRDAADECLSTGGMCRFVKESPLGEFIIGTEEGILHRLRNENPGKKFHPVGDLVCADMKKITMEKLLDSMREMKHRVTVDKEIALRARKAIDAMLAIA
jgi:quinolinate synthase